MTVDSQVLYDRLFADAIAAGLRAPDTFVRATAEVTRNLVETYIRQRANCYKDDLSTTAADTERAIEPILKLHQKSERIVSSLVRAAKYLLQPNGREMILRVCRDEPGREILRWRFVSLALPPGILIAATAFEGQKPPDAVRLLDASIGPDQPVALNHVHHAAMMSFEDLWASLRLRTLLRPGELLNSLQDKRAYCPRLHLSSCIGGKIAAEKKEGDKQPAKRRKHMAEWGDLLRQAFVARYVIDHHSSHSEPFTSCHDPACEIGRRAVTEFLRGRIKPYRATPSPYPWPDDLVSIERRYRNAISPSVTNRTDWSRREIYEDLAAEERQVLARAFIHLQPHQQQSPDPDFEALFLQYLRIKVAVFGLLVHPPGEHGLERFLEHFTQIKVYAPESDGLRPCPPNEPGLDVRSTEYRIAPDAWFGFLSRPGRSVTHDRRSDSRDHESAWLIHFKRSGYRHDRDPLPLFGQVIREMDSEADQIARALSNEAKRLRLLRGIDICGVEQSQPLWVSAQTLRRLRKHSGRVAGSRPSLGLERLRMTLHAGEDFLWLTSGVRAIAEPFFWSLIERGDRIGHGIAITLNPHEWWDRKKGLVIPVKRIDRLLDLAFLAVYVKDRNAQEEKWLNDQIKSVAGEIWQSNGAPETSDSWSDTAVRFWGALGGKMMRTMLSTPDLPKDPKIPTNEKWLHRYLWNRSVQERAANEINLSVGEDNIEQEFLKKARGNLICEMARWQVCIESNPSSNLIVGSLDGLMSQDFLHQRATEDRPKSGETLTWTISTDDPITFSTTLADEYAYAWAGMVLRKDKPCDPSYARALLDEAAATSMRMRFTVPTRGRRLADREGYRKSRVDRY